jgi:hypothetical protein
MDLSVELKKNALAKELLKLMFPDTYSDKWEVEITETGILYCTGDHENPDDCSYDRVDLSPKNEEIWKHKKRGTRYVKKYEGILQLEEGSSLRDGDSLYCYIGLDDSGMVWFRTPEEFHDGRFEYSGSHGSNKPVIPKGGNLERLISSLRKNAENDKLSAEHNGSYHGDMSASNRLKLLQRIEQAASLDYLVKYDARKFSPKDIRRLKLNAMWAAHRAFLNPFCVVEGDIPKERKDLISYYGLFLDACDTVDNFYVFDKTLVRKEYPDNIFDRMMGQIDYFLKRVNTLDLGEDVKTLSENCVTNILRIASNHSDEAIDD